MKKKPILSIMAALLMVFSVFPSTAFAASDEVDLAGVSSGFTVTLSAGTTNTFTITDSNPQTRTNIKIICGAGLNIILDGVSIDNSANGGICPISFTGTGNTLTLAPGSTNTLKGGADVPGVLVADGTSLSIGGTGILQAYGGANAAGIGSGTGIKSGLLAFTDGDVRAWGGQNGAGIGGGNQGACNTVNISGSAHVTATGGQNGAGIGGGHEAPDADNAASAIAISEGTVSATGGEGGAGIGGGGNCGSGTITITGGNITALGGGAASGIGNGESAGSGSFTNITISGGTVSATGGTDASNLGGAGIGSSYNAFACPVTISGGDIIAQGGYGGAGIGAGCQSLTGTVTISHATVNATGGRKGPGIGGLGSSGSITIKSGTVTAQAGSDGGYGGAAGIGGAIGGSITGEYGSCPITIEDGTVVAAGSANEFEEGGGAGIGGGTYCESAEITITGGDITATGGGIDSKGGSGIGSGYNGTTKAITISGGTVNATGSESNPGLGGKPFDASTSVIISEGTVFAEKGGNAVYDIGSSDINDGILNIYGRARVFLRNDAYRDPVTTTSHSHRLSDSGFNGSSYCGIPVSWQGSFGAFLRPYSLSYSLNGGSGILPSGTEQHINTTIPVSGGNGLSKAYYVFTGWNTRADGGGKAYAANSTYTFTASATLYAQWAPYTYSVVYESNDGSGTMDTSYHAYGLSQALNANTFKRTGFTFAGWARDAGGAVELQDGQTVLNLTSVKGGTVTLYAKWAVNTYTVAYDKNSNADGATASSAHTYSIDKALTKNGFTRTGFNFLGWAKSPGGTVAYADSQRVTNLTLENNGTITLYAVWASSGIYNIKTKVNSARYGKVTGAGTYAGGDMATITAIPANGYMLTKWTDGRTKVSADAVLSFPVAKTSTLTAYFARIGQPKLLTPKSIGSGSIKVSWKSVSGVTGYYVYRAATKWGQYTRIADVTGALTFTDSGLETGKKYFYKVQAYYVAGSKTTIGTYSKALSGKVK